MWMEREQKCLCIKLEQVGVGDGGVGMERKMESVPMRMWGDIDRWRDGSFRGGKVREREWEKNSVPAGPCVPP